MSRILIALLAASGAWCAAPGAVYNVLDYGAVADGKTDAAPAIRKAMEAAAKAGGGAVLLPAGEYLSSSINLLSRTTLELEAGAALKGSPRIDDYPRDPTRWSGESARAGLITAIGAHDVTIRGRGTIDGNSMAFHLDRVKTMQDGDKKYTRQGGDFMDPKFGTGHGPLAWVERPGSLIRFRDCENILITGVTIRDSPTWTVQINDSRVVTILGVRIHSLGSEQRIPNDDGIDLVRSRFVRISDAEIQVGDDCIALFGSQDVAVANCTLESRSAALRVGFDDGETRNCTFDNLVTRNSNRGIGIFVRGEGSVENILFSNIIMENRLFTGHWWGKAEPIHVSAIPFRASGAKLGHIKDVRFRNIIATADTGIVVHGSEESRIQGLVFDGVKLKIRNSPLHASYGGNFDLRATNNPETALFAHDIPGLYARWVSGMRIRDFDLEWEAGVPGWFTHGIECEDYQDIQIDGFRGGPAHAGGKSLPISLTRGTGAVVR